MPIPPSPLSAAQTWASRPPQHDGGRQDLIVDPTAAPRDASPSSSSSRPPTRARIPSVRSRSSSPTPAASASTSPRPAYDDRARISPRSPATSSTRSPGRPLRRHRPAVIDTQKGVTPQDEQVARLLRERVLGGARTRAASAKKGKGRSRSPRKPRSPNSPPEAQRAGDRRRQQVRCAQVEATPSRRKTSASATRSDLAKSNYFRRDFLDACSSPPKKSPPIQARRQSAQDRDSTGPPRCSWPSSAAPTRQVLPRQRPRRRGGA